MMEPAGVRGRTTAAYRAFRGGAVSNAIATGREGRSNRRGRSLEG